MFSIFDKKNLEQTQHDKDYFLNVLKERKCPALKKVLIMTVDGDGKVYLQQKGKKYEVFHLDWKEKLW